MRKLGWVMGFAGAWGAALGCSEKTLPLGAGPAEGGESAQSGQGGAPTHGGTHASGGNSEGGNVAGSPDEGGTGGMARGGSGGASSGGRAPIVRGGNGGNGAESGECSDAQGSPITFPSCKRPTFVLGGSTCSEAETRQQLACGEPGSNMDANCCLRDDCRDDSECGANAACIPRLIQTGDVGGSQFEECSVECGKCSCITYADADFRGYCVDRSEDLTRFECDSRGLSCAALANWRELLRSADVIWPGDLTATGISSYAARTIACEDQLDLELQERCQVTSKCECTNGTCTIGLDDFHALEWVLGDSRTGYNLKAIREACPVPEYGYGHYSECSDGTVRYEVILFGENKYQLVFPRGSDALSYGSVDGYVSELCGVPNELAVISTGPAPAPSDCRTCAFCESEWDTAGEGGAGGLPRCLFDDAGNISLPPP